MSEQIHPAVCAASENIDARPLTEQLGSADELTTLSPVAGAHFLTKIHSLPALREFLHHYRDQILGPGEFRQIYQAYQFSGQNFLRELLALDKELARDATLQEFQVASRHVGKRQLNRLATMRDLRLVQRYREAVNDGQAHGWHTLVYGLVLSIYSIPLRQGLLHYGRQTLRGFVLSAGRALDLPDDKSLELQLELNASLPPLIENTLGANGHMLKVIP